MGENCDTYFFSYSLKGRLRRPFARPSGVGGIIVKNAIGQTHIWDRHTDRRTNIWDRHTDRHTYGTDIQTDTYGL